MGIGASGTHNVENGAGGVVGELILGCVSHKALLVGEGDPGRRYSVTWIEDTCQLRWLRDSAMAAVVAVTHLDR